MICYSNHYSSVCLIDTNIISLGLMSKHPYTKKAHWVQNRLIINLWQHCIEGDREFKTKGIIWGGDGNTSVTRIITLLKVEHPVTEGQSGQLK